jgi:TetR/AcrR family transcriptional regulator, transcriptional repressor for nem operon
MSSGRPCQFDPETALDAAMQAFWSRGYAECSMQDLLGATGLSKSSLYLAFGGKRSLFTRCLLRYRDQSSQRLCSGLDTARSPLEFIADTLNGVAREVLDGGSPRGCFMMNAATEFGQRDQPIADLIADSLERFRRVFREAARRGQDTGEITRARSADELATYLLTTMAGLRTMVKGGASPATIRTTVEVALQALR